MKAIFEIKSQGDTRSSAYLRRVTSLAFDFYLQTDKRCCLIVKRDIARVQSLERLQKWRNLKTPLVLEAMSLKKTKYCQGHSRQPWKVRRSDMATSQKVWGNCLDPASTLKKTVTRN